MSSREIELSGTPFERGRQYGEIKAKQIKTYYHAKTYEFAHLLPEWKKMANAQLKPMQQYCPIAYQEMRGTSAGSQIPLIHLMQLTVFPELEAFDHFHPFRCDSCGEVIQTPKWRRCGECDIDVCLTCEGSCKKGCGGELTETSAQSVPPSSEETTNKKCTSFVKPEPNKYLVGQTDEENPPYNLHGSLHSIQKMIDENNSTSLLYTAPGTPCMAGMNGYGLCVLANTLFVPDNNFWNNGAPTLAVTREILTKKTLPDAVEYVKSVVLAIPLNFVISMPGYGCSNLEASCVEDKEIRTDEKIGEVYVHCNHCESESFINREILPNPPISTKQRQEKLEHQIQLALTNNISMELDWLKNALLKPPIMNPFVIATILMEPVKGVMHVRFGVPTVSKKKKKKRKRKGDEKEGEEQGIEDGIRDWRLMEINKNYQPDYETYTTK
ncbi:hypothetical protein TrLO_g818 [Triparma laevis f. longispina]|uniref:Peptidase C45 hydrolase domain-containing protein n=1 Tax=Triparma laevis f. longispina TaxID=1714387 RepID=A0A9W7EEU0_9STRA|nr:hypothetical protein TrLO_g818 [Triparma laevis f. longispina]